MYGPTVIIIIFSFIFSFFLCVVVVVETAFIDLLVLFVFEELIKINN